MSAIQGVSGMWIDGFAAGQNGGSYRSSALNASLGTSASIYGIDDDSDSMTSIISDVEEEGEVETTHEESDVHQSGIDVLSDEIEAGADEMDSSAEIVAAIAAHIGVIEAAMRRHQFGGVADFRHAETDEDPADEGFVDSVVDRILGNPERALATIKPGRDRRGILSLLS
jgi:hypothetical protein